MRLFFAVLLPDEVRTSLSAVQARLQGWAGKEGIKWEPEDHFHFTLKFLGNVSPEDLECVKQVGRDAAGLSGPFEAAIEGIGVFPDIRRPRIIWAGVSRGVPHLSRIAEYLNGGLTECGFDQERHRFKPHITLARIKSSTGETSARKMFASQTKELEKVDKGGVFFVYNVVLIESELKPQGSVYTVLDSFTFPEN